MVYRKVELSAAGIDIGWPYQVAIRASEAATLVYIPSSGPHSSLCLRAHTVSDGQREYRIYAFADREQAARFRDSSAERISIRESDRAVDG